MSVSFEESERAATECRPSTSCFSILVDLASRTPVSERRFRSQSACHRGPPNWSYRVRIIPADDSARPLGRHTISEACKSLQLVSVAGASRSTSRIGMGHGTGNALLFLAPPPLPGGAGFPTSRTPQATHGRLGSKEVAVGQGNTERKKEGRETRVEERADAAADESG